MEEILKGDFSFNCPADSCGVMCSTRRNYCRRYNGVALLGDPVPSALGGRLARQDFCKAELLMGWQRANVDP